MKKIFFLITLIAATIACNKVEQSFDNASDNLTTLSFQASGADFTKTSLGSDFSILWSTSDKITVFSGENFATSSEFAVESVAENNHVATFSGLAAVSPEYYAVFPASADATISAQGAVTATLPTVQNATAGSFGAEANLSIAHAAGNNELFFRNAGALLSVDIQAADVTGIKIETLDGDPLTGTATISYNNGEPVANVTDGKNFVESTVAGAGVYYFVVYPGNFEQGFKITLTKNGCSASMTNTKAIYVERNGNVLLGTVAADIPWNLSITPGEKIYIKGLKEGENGQEVSYISADYYARRPVVGDAVPNFGDKGELAMAAYNYEVWAKVNKDDKVYFETESGVLFAIDEERSTIVPISSAEEGTAWSVSNDPHRIRLNLPSGEVQIARVALVNYSVYTTGVNTNLEYDKAGRWKKENYVIEYGYQSWDPVLTRYHFSMWFNWYGGHHGHSIDIWQNFGPCTSYNNHPDLAPATENPANEYFYLQPRSGDAWENIFYMSKSIYDPSKNKAKRGTLNVFMNNTYGHFTHGFTDVVDNI